MKTIHHVVDMDATADRVWAALTDLTALAGWWSTKVEEDGGSGVGSRLNWTFAGDFNPGHGDHRDQGGDRGRVAVCLRP